MFLTEVGKSENREENDIVKVTGVEITKIKKGDGYYKAVATVYLGEYAVNGILISTGSSIVVILISGLFK